MKKLSIDFIPYTIYWEWLSTNLFICVYNVSAAVAAAYHKIKCWEVENNRYNIDWEHLEEVDLMLLLWIISINKTFFEKSSISDDENIQRSMVLLFRCFMGDEGRHLKFM